MKNEKTPARIAGYSIVITLIMGVAFVLYLIIAHFMTHNELITIYFPRIGELKVEQPFMLNGMQVGEIVATSENVYEGVAVTIRLTRNLTVRNGYQIYCSDVGLFGTKREIVLINGPENAPEVTDQNQLKGVYYVGITEIISSMGKLQWAMNEMSRAFNEYLSGKSSALQFISKIHDVSQRGDQISAKLSSVNDMVGTAIPEGIEKVSDLTVEANSIENSLSRDIPGFRREVESLLGTIDSVLRYLPDAIKKAETAAAKVATLDEKDTMEKLVKELKSIQEQFEYIRTTAHRLRLILRKYE